MKDKKILFITGIVLLFLMTVGMSYAYFSLSVSGNADAKDMVVEAGTLRLTYTDSPEIIMQNIKPGQTITKKVTVKNTGTLDTAYNLVWQELYNKIGRNDLVISYTCERLNSFGTVDGTCAGLTETPVKTKTITKNISIESGVTHNYTITITFKETGENQNYNQGKSFSGVLGIEEYSKIAGTLKNKFYEESGMTDRSLVKAISFYSDNRVIDGAESYDVSEEQDGSVKMYVKQNSENSSLYDLTIVGNGVIAFPEDSSFLFSFNVYVPCRGPLSNLTLTEFNNSIDTSNVTNMIGMFTYSAATTLDLSSFDTRNVTNMSSMLAGSQATTIDLSSFDTSKVTDMNDMFAYSQATIVDLSSFDTSSVTDMNAMFANSQATIINLSSFDTSNVTDMSSMFYNSQATALDLSNFDTSNVTDMVGMFSNSQVPILDLSNFNTSNVTTMYAMFKNSNNLKTIYASVKYNTSKVTSSSNMFTGCTSLAGGQGTTYDSTKVDKTYARIDGGTSSPGYFTSK